MSGIVSEFLVVHYAERKSLVLYAACGEPLVQGVASSAMAAEVTCWKCRFKLETTRDRRGKARRKKVAA